MVFADLKNDFVFRRIFATHPDILNKATFTREELDAYQKVIDEIQQVRELAEAKWAEGKAAGIAEGHRSGLAEGHRSGKIAAIVAVLAARGISVTAEARARIEACKEESTLDRWLAGASGASSLEDVFASPKGSA